jgi:2-oxoglutarate ferredoxin oxidoreductase subunit alpha
LITPNIHALEMGHQYATTHFECPLGIHLKAGEQTPKHIEEFDHILMDGNTATALGAVYAGATVAAWYPITPSTSVVDAFEKYCRRLRIDPGTGKKNYAIVQAEDELSAMGMVIGANWNGARAFTATSGPGVSLMSEFLGLAYFAEVPCGAGRRAARRPLYRHAHPHPTIRYSRRGLRLSRRYQARVLFSQPRPQNASA